MFKIYKNTAKVFLAVSVLFGATMFGSSAAVAVWREICTN